MKRALLLGRTQQAFGEVGEVADANVAVALSRGGAPKPYAHTDPNEDAVLAASGARGFLVAAADGHWGLHASEAAIERLWEAFVADWVDGPERSADRWYQDLLHALVVLNEAVFAAHAEDVKPRTTFAIALARPGEDLLVATSIGDTHLFVATPDAVREILPKPRKFSVLGQERWSASKLEQIARFHVHPLAGVQVLVAVTDGLSEEGIGVADPEAAVRAAVDAARPLPPRARAGATARAVVDTALAAHVAQQAGDNVGAAVAWRPRTGPASVSSLLEK
jgi:hypothetical protein